MASGRESGQAAAARAALGGVSAPFPIAGDVSGTRIDRFIAADVVRGATCASRSGLKCRGFRAGSGGVIATRVSHLAKRR